MQQASDWTLVHFGSIRLLAARPLSHSQVITKGGPERLFVMECRLVRLLLLVTAARKLDSAHATSLTTLISLVQHARKQTRKQMHLQFVVKRSQSREKVKLQLCILGVFRHCDNCLYFELHVVLLKPCETPARSLLLLVLVSAMLEKNNFISLC